MPMFSRVLSAVAAGAFGQIVTIATQVVLTPLFFLHWGATEYGEWLLLSGIPAYMTIADAGLGSAAGNDMTIRVGAGDLKGAQRTFRAALIVAFGAALIASVFGVLISVLVLFDATFDLKFLGGMYGAKIVVLLSIYLGFNFAGGVVYSGFRCCGRNAIGIGLSNLSRLTEAIVVGLTLALHSRAVGISLVMLANKAVFFVLQLVWLRIACDWLFTPKLTPDLTIIRRLITPAISFMAFPLANALLLQGPLLILSSTIGGKAIAVFSAFRTVARLPLQLTNMLNTAVWPEVSLAYGLGDIGLLTRLHSMTIAASGYGSILASAVILSLGHIIVQHWLRGQIPYDGVLMTIMLAGTVTNAIWNGSSIVLSATNQHARFGATLVVVSAIGILISYPAALAFRLQGIAIVMSMIELVMAFFVMQQTLAVCHQTIQELFRDITNLPKMMRSILRHYSYERKGVDVS